MSNPTSPVAATNLVRKVLNGVNGIRAVHTRRASDCLHTIVHLTADADADAVLAFLDGAFGDVQVDGKYLTSRFISIAWVGRVTDAMLAEAYEMNRADDNAARFYRAARPVDLRRWLSPTYVNASPVDPWTKGRRVRQMQAQLAELDAELCRLAEHFDAFGDPPNEDAEAHYAEHLRILRG